MTAPASASARRAVLVAGLGYGDEGKGTTIDWLARRYSARLVVRYNGGAQAGHNVVLPDGTHHTFSQFGAATFAGACTFLSRHVVVNPATMLREAEVLAAAAPALVKNPLSTVTVDEDAFVTTRYHVAACRIRELARGPGRHGSCGMGVNETVQDAADGAPSLRAGGLRVMSRFEIASRLRQIREHKMSQVRDVPEDVRTTEEFVALRSAAFFDTILDDLTEWARRVAIVPGEWLAERLREPGAVLFEGAQGVLLDQKHGFFPHVTRSDCTFANADELLRDAGYDGRVTRLGVTRTYQTRHGAGPMPSEASYLRHWADGDHNVRNEWQGNFRVGHLDLTTGLHAARCVGRLDGLVMTWVDSFRSGRIPVHVEVDPGDVPTLDLTALLERLTSIKHMSLDEYAEQLGTTVAAVSRGPTHEDKVAVGGLL